MLSYHTSLLKNRYTLVRGPVLVCVHPNEACRPRHAYCSRIERLCSLLTRICIFAGGKSGHLYHLIPGSRLHLHPPHLTQFVSRGLGAGRSHLGCLVTHPTAATVLRQLPEVMHRFQHPALRAIYLHCSLDHSTAIRVSGTALIGPS